MLSVWKNSSFNKGRCVNIDWLECYCMESVDNFPHNAEFFRAGGWQVREREYGTRQYREMFVLLDNEGLPFVEIRRNPVAGDDGRSNVGIFSEFSCHIRLSNRYCYHNDAVSLYSEFLHRYDYAVQRLYRIDICLDFEKFDSGDDPNVFIKRYLKGVYTKINQCHLSAHAMDRWNVREWNSVAWGSPASMVSTKLYDKTLELAEAKDKPYIRLAWQRAGLVDDFVALTKIGADGVAYNPKIWRLEFSVKSSARNWVMVEDCNGHKTKRVAKEHTLATYASKELQLHAFAMLAHHYFHFKIFEDGVRKDRCRDKHLFDFGLNHEPYKLDVLLADAPKSFALDVLQRRLEWFKFIHPERGLQQACDVILNEIKKQAVRNSLPDYYDKEADVMLQRLLALRLDENPKNDLAEDFKKIRAFFDRADDFF